MFIASERRKDNIAEYLLYMWQIEDIIRASGLDIERIDKTIINPQISLTDEQRLQLHEWYESLIDMMRRENVAESGHLQINVNTLNMLDELHRAVLADPRYADYAKSFYEALPAIVDLRSRAGDKRKGEIETCFDALYGLLMLRLSGRQISTATDEAMGRIARFTAMLAHYFRLYEDDKLFRDEEEN